MCKLFHRRWHLSTIVVLGCLCLTGCQSNSKDWKFADLFDLDKGIPWGDDEPEVDIPVRIVGTWTNTVLHKQGQAPQRGFGGRLVFFGREGEDPILVDGQLVVYAFDEAERDPVDHRPTRRYVFPPGQFAKHMSESEIGPSYSFWLPWDELGGPKTEISLICRFEPREGTIVVGEQTSHLLPGTMLANKSKNGGEEAKRPTHPIQQVSYSEQVAAAERRAQREPQPVRVPRQAKHMKTTTISLPSSFRAKDGR